MAFNQYSGQCVGRLMYFLYKYNTQSDSWQMGDGTVTAYGKQAATYTWDEDGDSDYPTFVFIKEYDWMHEVQASEKQELIERDGREKYSLKAENKMVKEKYVGRQKKLYSQIVGQEPSDEKLTKWQDEAQEKYGDDKLY